MAAALVAAPLGASAQGAAKTASGRTATRDLGPPEYNRLPSARTQKICDGKTTMIRPGVTKVTYNLQLCDQAILADINAAHKAEHIPPMTRPAGYEKLSKVKQLVWAVNAERKVRGLPAMPEDKSYDAMAQQAAVNGDDPSGPNGYIYGGVAAGALTSLDAMYEWMYDDGPGSLNPECIAGNYTGCWAHRGHLLFNCPGKMGAGVYQQSYTVVTVCDKGIFPKGAY
jgi:hypothetical protein